MPLAVEMSCYKLCCCSGKRIVVLVWDNTVVAVGAAAHVVAFARVDRDGKEEN
jgi:hypothetical protein